MTTHNKGQYNTQNNIRKITGGLPPRQQQEIGNLVHNIIMQRFLHNLTARRGGQGGQEGQERQGRQGGQEGQERQGGQQRNI